MKLRNKKTGEIGWLYCDHISIPKKMTVFAEDKDLSVNHWDYNSLAELNEEWEDYEEPKDHWYINYQGEVYVLDPEAVPEYSRNAKQIGNYFETKEEAEKAVEKLKALKRLKDKGFKFTAYQLRELNIKFFLDHGYTEMVDDLDLLFGGEE